MIDTKMSYDLNQSPPTLNTFNNDPYLNNSSYDSFTTLDPALNCFLQGTLILTTSRGYVPIEDLQDGESLKTTKGETILRKKLYRCVQGTQENLPYKIPQNHYGDNTPTQDTFLSPLHCLYKNGNWFCMCQSSFLQDSTLLNQPLHYYHLLTTDYNMDYIYCNGLISESLKPSKENYELYKDCFDEIFRQKYFATIPH